MRKWLYTSSSITADKYKYKIEDLPNEFYWRDKNTVFIHVPSNSK